MKYKKKDAEKLNEENENFLRQVLNLHFYTYLKRLFFLIPKYYF